MIRLWRRFMAWLNEPDEVTVYIQGYQPVSGPQNPQPAEGSGTGVSRPHCATCAKGVRKG